MTTWTPSKKILFYVTNISDINIFVNSFHMKVNKCFQVDESFIQGNICEKFLVLAKISTLAPVGWLHFVQFLINLL